MKLSNIMRKAINEELKDCRKWYKKFLEQEQGIKITSLAQLEEAMEGVEPKDDFENTIFSSGYITGMKQAIRTIAQYEAKEAL
jgi:hypothetical protein